MRGMSQALHFGKSTMDNGYGSFVNMLEYKLERKQKTFVRIDRFYPSSKLCSCCGKIKEDLKLSDRTYICSCGNIMDRDVNAAVNIRNEGKRILGLGAAQLIKKIRKTTRFRVEKNRGTRGDSLLILGSTEPLSKKPPLQAKWVSGGSMSHC